MSKILKYLCAVLISLVIIIALAIGVTYSSHDIPVLNYHQINDTDFDALTLSSSEFAAQMKDLYEEGYTTLTPDQLLADLHGNNLPSKPVLITFDDGYEDNYRNAYPILEKYHFNATIFLISNLVGQDHYLNWNEIKDMQQHQITFEGHTFSHPFLSKETDENVLKKELLDSKHDLENHLGYRIDYLAYPYGDYNPHVMEEVQKYGYRAAFTVHLGDDTGKDNPYALPRVPIFQAYTHTFLRFWLSLHFPTLMNDIQTEKLRLFAQHEN